jgi:hypothetical protein
MTENTTNLSFLGVVKWLIVIGSFPCFIKAWQGVIGRQTATGYGRFDAGSTQLLTGADAIKYGLWNLLYGVLAIGAAWAIWYFWQQYED